MSEVHLPAFCSRHLKLLKYPHSIASVWNVQQCVVCVKWLEDEIFRVLPPAKRDWLGDRNGWEANASSYLEKLHLKMKLDVTAQDGGFSRCLPLMICRAVEEMTADSLYGMDDDSTRVENPTIPIHSDMLSESANSESTQFINTVIGCEDFPPPTLAEAIKVRIYLQLYFQMLIFLRHNVFLYPCNGKLE